MAFVRLDTPIQTGAEKRTPVRFLFVVLSPPSEISSVVQMATAFASIMLDEDFTDALRTCVTTASFRELLVRELDCVTIVPSSHSTPLFKASASSLTPRPTSPRLT